MVSSRLLIRLALKKGIRTKAKIIRFVMEHPDYHNEYSTVVSSFTVMLGTNEIQFIPKKNKFILSGYPVDEMEDKRFESSP